MGIYLMWVFVQTSHKLFQKLVWCVSIEFDLVWFQTFYLAASPCVMCDLL